MRREFCMYKGDCPSKTDNSKRGEDNRINLFEPEAWYCRLEKKEGCNQKETNYKRIQRVVKFLR